MKGGGGREKKNVCMYACIDVYIKIYMYVCIYIYVCMRIQTHTKFLKCGW